MIDRKEKSAKFIQQVIDKSQMPRNQISSLSGLTNTYIRDLESGSYASVRREKLIFFAVAVSLTLKETDALLSIFDRTPLSEEDIPTFMEVSERRWTTAAMLPLRDGFTLELALLSAERHPGPHRIVSYEPTYCLYSEGHRRYAERNSVAGHPLYGELVESISRERRRVFKDNLVSHGATQYLCRECLETYMDRSVGAEERGWRIRHLKNIIEALQTYDSFSIYLINLCPRTTFTLKMAADAKKDTEKLCTIFWPQHKIRGERSGRLSGYTTDNPVIIQNFKQELTAIQETVIDAYSEKADLIDHLNEMMAEPE
ncbi:MAG: hypothetical protein HKM93_20805 [Desulfobacteraceae bacterium]|nr:hypothetical protein [Desulfobacteraceae bacterium]